MRDRKSSGEWPDVTKKYVVREFVCIVEEGGEEELLTLEEAEKVRDDRADNAEAWGNDVVFRIVEVE